MDDKRVEALSKKYGESIVRLEVPESIVPLVRLLRLVAMYRYQINKGADLGFPSVYQALLDEVSREVSAFRTKENQK